MYLIGNGQAGSYVASIVYKKLIGLFQSELKLQLRTGSKNDVASSYKHEVIFDNGTNRSIKSGLQKIRSKESRDKLRALNHEIRNDVVFIIVAGGGGSGTAITLTEVETLVKRNNTVIVLTFIPQKWENVARANSIVFSGQMLNKYENRISIIPVFLDKFKSVEDADNYAVNLLFSLMAPFEIISATATSKTLDKDELYQSIRNGNFLYVNNKPKFSGINLDNAKSLVYYKFAVGSEENDAEDVRLEAKKLTNRLSKISGGIISKYGLIPVDPHVLDIIPEENRNVIIISNVSFNEFFKEMKSEVRSLKSSLQEKRVDKIVDDEEIDDLAF